MYGIDSFLIDLKFIMSPHLTVSENNIGDPKMLVEFDLTSEQSLKLGD